MDKFTHSIAHIISNLPEPSSQFQRPSGHDPYSSVYDDRLSTFLRLRTVYDVPLETTPYSLVSGSGLLRVKVKVQATANVNSNDEPSDFKLYRFSDTFDGSSSSKMIYDRCCLPLVHDVLSGKDALLFSFGGFLAGQTYTMRGIPHDPGFIPMVLDHIFASKNFYHEPVIGSCEFNRIYALDKNKMNEAKKLKKSILSKCEAKIFPSEASTSKPDQDKYRYLCYLKYTEMCNEIVYDLLAPHGRRSVVRFNDHSRPYYIEQSKSVMVSTYDEAIKVYNYGWFNQQKNMQKHGLDTDRVHSFLCITLIKFKMNSNRGIFDPQVSNLMLGELMGYEQSKAQYTSIWANKSDEPLITLQECLSKYRSNNRNISQKDIDSCYSRCNLTKFFEPYLTGTGKVWMLLHVNPTPKYLNETILNLEVSQTSSSLTSLHQHQLEQPVRQMASPIQGQQIQHQYMDNNYIRDNKLQMLPNPSNPFQSSLNNMNFRIESLTKILSEANERMAAFFQPEAPIIQPTYNIPPPAAHPFTPNQYLPHSNVVNLPPNIKSSADLEKMVARKVERCEYEYRGKTIQHQYFIFKRDTHEIMSFNEANDFVMSKVVTKYDDRGTEYYECDKHDQECCNKEHPYTTHSLSVIINHIFPLFFIFPCPVCFVDFGTRHGLLVHLRKHK